MGTSISLHITDSFENDYLAYCSDEVFTWLRSVEQQFSTYRPDSEISHLRRGEMRLSECSLEVRAVVDHCTQLWSTTDGYFDAYATGVLDPSGFVKGWAVQAASDRLVAAGCTNHCINAGGDIRARGSTFPGHPWRVSIQHPLESIPLSWVVAGTDLAVATSSMYERGRHIINPREGRPSTDLRAVTVVGPDLGMADGYATAAVAMGLPALAWLAALADHEAAVITDDGRCFRSDGLPTED
ncbi:MAG: FAD:protein FMN transferase [Micromonosporaceae bacterium]|nr:FAD:protein FMN transferase [Micromonosporaceae bacterium]